jgi:predicted 3-demethylubiquinone-9 3-methyltransferase (glyoxalase superfamily)
MQKVTPFLWFNTEAEEAANFYVSVFNGRTEGSAKITSVMPGAGGKAMGVSFELTGSPFMSLNGGPMYKFTEAISLFVDCADQDEVDYYWAKLLEGGSESQCGWLKDKYGLSWQIVPKILTELLSNPDPVKAGKAMNAMLLMKKIDIAALKAAAEA